MLVYAVYSLLILAISVKGGTVGAFIAGLYCLIGVGFVTAFYKLDNIKHELEKKEGDKK